MGPPWQFPCVSRPSVSRRLYRTYAIQLRAFALHLRRLARTVGRMPLATNHFRFVTEMGARRSRSCPGKPWVVIGDNVAIHMRQGTAREKRAKYVFIRIDISSVGRLPLHLSV